MNTWLIFQQIQFWRTYLKSNNFSIFLVPDLELKVVRLFLLTLIYPKGDNGFLLAPIFAGNCGTSGAFLGSNIFLNEITCRVQLYLWLKHNFFPGNGDTSILFLTRQLWGQQWWSWCYQGPRTCTSCRGRPRSGKKIYIFKGLNHAK